MITLIIIISIILVLFLIFNMCKPIERYENSDYYINVFPHIDTHNTSKYILYHNNTSAIESNNNKCIWDPIKSKYNLESVVKKTFIDKFKNMLLTKNNNNVYKLGDNTYLKHINENIYHLSKNKDFNKLDKIIYYNKEKLSIKHPNDITSDELVYHRKIRDNVHSNYDNSGDRYNYISKEKSVGPLLSFNIFYLIKEINRNRYYSNLDKK